MWVERIGSAFNFGLVVETPGRLFASSYRKKVEDTFDIVAREIEAHEASKQKGLFGDEI